MSWPSAWEVVLRIFEWVTKLMLFLSRLILTLGLLLDRKTCLIYPKGAFFVFLRKLGEWAGESDCEVSEFKPGENSTNTVGQMITSPFFQAIPVWPCGIRALQRPEKWGSNEGSKQHQYFPPYIGSLHHCPPSEAAIQVSIWSFRGEAVGRLSFPMDLLLSLPTDWSRLWFPSGTAS